MRLVRIPDSGPGSIPSWLNPDRVIYAQHEVANGESWMLVYVDAGGQKVKFDCRCTPVQLEQILSGQAVWKPQETVS